MEKLNQCLNLISSSDKEKEKLAMKKIDNLAKPLGSLGTIENIVSGIAGITGKFDYEIKKKNIIVMCADNGVVEEGVSICPKVVRQYLQK